MKVLLSHNFYQSSSPSGEDVVFGNEVDLLRKRGVEVITYELYNDNAARLPKLNMALTVIWSRRTYRELKIILKKERPDIVHFHNMWYLASPSAYYACKDAGIPVVQTLHNFRMYCVNGLLMKEGKVCEECIGKYPWKGVKYGCYRGSRLYSLPIALTASLHKLANTWESKVDAYIALTEFGRKKFIECGLPSEKIFVKPNFLSDPPESQFAHEGYAIFLGRLSTEKGLNVLINAISILMSTLSLRMPIKIVGEGPLREQVEGVVNARSADFVHFTGKVSFEQCMNLLKKSRFLIMPSLWYEGFPMVIREAFACGKPVIASRLGAMAELVENGKTGLLFEPGNPEDLARTMKWMLEHEDACIEMGKNARKVFEEKYSADTNFEILMNIYSKVLEEHGAID